MKIFKFFSLFSIVIILFVNSCGDSIECGDGNIDIAEECDDANDINDDGCSNLCLLPICGDGIINQAFEECDDGNDNDNDECANDCSLI